MDSGTSLIGGPKKIIHEINTMLGAVPAEWGEYVVDCAVVSKLPEVSISFGGK